MEINKQPAKENIVKGNDPANEGTFYRAYCETEGKYLGNWSAEEQVANNSKSHHEANNEGHSVSIKTQ